MGVKIFTVCKELNLWGIWWGQNELNLKEGHLKKSLHNPDKGILFDLINFMAKVDNFTFTLVEAGDVCGRCYDRYNCTGMTGMVNRGEVDLALGMNRMDFCEYFFPIELDPILLISSP